MVSFFRLDSFAPFSQPSLFPSSPNMELFWKEDGGGGRRGSGGKRKDPIHKSSSLRKQRRERKGEGRQKSPRNCPKTNKGKPRDFIFIFFGPASSHLRSGTSWEEKRGKSTWAPFPWSFAYTRNFPAFRGVQVGQFNLLDILPGW